MTELNSLSSKNLHRRDFLKITAVMGGLALGGGLLKLLESHTVHRLHDTRLLMGTWINLTVLTDDRRFGQEALNETFTGLERLVPIFDHRLPDGPLGRLNRNGYLADPPEKLLTLIREACALSETTGGAWDISIHPLVEAASHGRTITPKDLELVNYRQINAGTGVIRLEQPGMSVTLDGIGKGRVIDGGVQILEQLGFPHVLVEAGGDLYAGPAPTGEAAWKIGITHPRPDTSGQLIGSFALQQLAAATSGDYQHALSKDRAHHHIIDPRTGRSPQDLSSATVLAPNAALADALSTTLMVLGVEEGLDLVGRMTGVECLLIGKDLTIHTSPGFPDPGISL